MTRHLISRLPGDPDLAPGPRGVYGGWERLPDISQQYEIDAKTPYRGAQQLQKMLTIEEARRWGIKQSRVKDIYLRKTYDGGGWEVAWEGGPSEWTITISSGAHLWSWRGYGQGDYSYPTLVNISSLPTTHGIFFEPYNHYTMACYYA